MKTSSKILKINRMVLFASILFFLIPSCLFGSWDSLNQFEQHLIPPQPMTAGKAASAAVYPSLALPIIPAVTGDSPVYDSLSYAAALGITHGIKEGLKSHVNRARPDGSSDDSFPSGHAAGAGAAFGFLLYMNSRNQEERSYLGISGVLLGSTAAGRVLTREHYPTDILTGLLLGIAVGYAVPAAADLLFGH